MKVSVPGKIILFGEHSVVYPGFNALLSTISLTTEFTSNIIKDNYSEITSGPKTKRFTLNEAKDMYRKTKYLYDKFLIDSDISKINHFIGADLNFPKIFIGLISDRYNINKKIKINIKSEIPIGAGFGASATIATGIIKSVLMLNKISFDNDDIFKLVKEMEDFQHGHSSGADPACVINGGLILYKHNLDGSRSFQKIKMKNNLNKNLYIINTGKPSESTGEMISTVKKVVDLNSKHWENKFQVINKIIAEFVEKNDVNFLSLLNKSGMILEELNIVNKKFKRFSSEIRKNHGAIKISGGGGLSNKGSGIAICVIEDKTYLDSLLNKYGYTLVKAKLL